jgi:hypothetical protein
MDIGQALAMMQYANQMQDYASQQRKQPNVDWSQIATQFTPQAEQQAYTLSPAAAQASIGPALPYGYMPTYAAPEVIAEVPRATMGYMPQEASPLFADLYGAPPTPDAQQMFAYNPQDLTGVTGGMPSFEPTPQTQQAQVFKMPPIPIRGAMQQPAEEPMTFSSRPPQGMTDAAPFMTMPVQPGQALAMAEQPVETPIKAEETPEQQQKRLEEEQAQQFSAGQQFEVMLNNKPYTVLPGFTNQPNQKIRIQDAEGNISAVPIGNEKLYKQVQNEYQRRIQMAMPKEAGYDSKIKIGGQFLPATIRTDQDNVTRVYYKDPNLGEELEYDDVFGLNENNFKGPVDSPNPMMRLSQAQQERRDFINPVLTKLSSVVSPVKATASTPEISANLFAEEFKDEQGRILPRIIWSYRDPQTNTKYTAEEAEKLGILPKDTVKRLRQEEDTYYSDLLQKAQAEADYQAKSPETMLQVNLQRNKQQTDNLNAMLAAENAKPSPDPKEIKRLNDALDVKSKELIELNKQGQFVSGPAGITAMQAGGTVRAFSLDPLSKQGMLAIAGGATSEVTPGRDVTSEQLTMDKIAERVKAPVMGRTVAKPMVVAQKYNAAIGSLSNRLRLIGEDAVNYAIDNPGVDPNSILDEPVKFTYSTIDGSNQYTVDMTLRDAIDKYTQADETFRNDPTEQNKNALINAAMPFSGSIYVPSLDKEYPVSRTSAERSLANVGYLLQAPAEQNLAIAGRDVYRGSSADIKPDQQQMTQRSPGSTSPTVNRQTVYPVYNTGKDKFEPASIGYNLFVDVIPRDGDTYDFYASEFVPKNASSAIRTQLGRTVLNDGGIPNPTEEKQFETIIQNINKDISGDNGAPARIELMTALGDGINSLGIPLAKNASNAGGMFAQRMEGLRDWAKKHPNDIAGAKAEVEKVVRDLIANASSQNAFANSHIAKQTAKYSTKSEYTGQFLAPGAKPEGQLEVFDQAVDAVANAAWLSIGSGWNYSEMKVGSGATVQWMYNPFYNGGQYNQSVISIPSSLTNPQTAQVQILTKQQAEDVKAGKFVNQPADLAYQEALLSSRYIADAISNIKNTVGNYKDELANMTNAGNYFQEDMQGKWTDRTRKGQTMMKMDNDTKTAMGGKFAQDLILASLFPPNRKRTFQRNVPFFGPGFAHQVPSFK